MTVEERLLDCLNILNLGGTNPALVMNPKPERRLVEDFGCDSLDLVELRIVIEDTFACEELDSATDEEWETLKTVGDVIEFVRKKIK
jgi:acyl carrier protein